MHYRILGKTGLKISCLGMGGIPIQRTDAAETGEVVRLLHSRGVNFIDTARGYTVSEEYLGQALAGLRQDFVLATKSTARTKEEMARDIDISLKNLCTDYIDLYQIHNPNAQQLEQVIGPGGALEALQEAKAAGKIGHIGVTLHALEVFDKALEMDWVETVMFPYNIVETQALERIAVCAQKGIGFICMKPLAGGAIDDAPLALRYILQNSAVSVVIPGVASVSEAEQNLAAAEDPAPLTAQEQAKLQTIRDSLGTQFCRRCNYCAPCTAGIPISAVFLMEGYYSRYQLQDWAKVRYSAFAKKASDCVDCGVCESRCPYQLPIRQMLKKAKDIFGE